VARTFRRKSSKNYAIPNGPGFIQLTRNRQPKRRELLLKDADIIEANAERPSYLETIVVGKPSSLCLAFKIPTAVETIPCTI
jgi:acyl-CoA reductase-like NAD-dependent aldehyde dehydrogenase